MNWKKVNPGSYFLTKCEWKHQLSKGNEAIDRFLRVGLSRQIFCNKFISMFQTRLLCKGVLNITEFRGLFLLWQIFDYI